MSGLNSDAKELAGPELVKLAEAEEAFNVFFYTPLCGTCKVALRMLGVAEAAEPGITVYRCNLNFAPELAERWQIGSVPCLAQVRNGQAVQLLYRMSSVQELLLWLRQNV